MLLAGINAFGDWNAIAGRRPAKRSRSKDRPPRCSGPWSSRRHGGRDWRRPLGGCSWGGRGRKMNTNMTTKTKSRRKGATMGTRSLTQRCETGTSLSSPPACERKTCSPSPRRWTPPDFTPSRSGAALHSTPPSASSARILERLNSRSASRRRRSRCLPRPERRRLSTLRRRRRRGALLPACRQERHGHLPHLRRPQRPWNLETAITSVKRAWPRPGHRLLHDKPCP